MAGTSSNIPIETLSHEEMHSIDAALASASASAASSPVTPPSIHSHTSVQAKSDNSIPVRAKRSLFNSAEPDIEDYGKMVMSKKKTRVAETLLHRFRSKRGLFVTDVTKTEWCEKQMEFSLFFEEWKSNNEPQRHDDDFDYGGGRKNNEAKKAGIARHTQLEKEVLKHVEVEVNSEEDYMALKLVNFISGVNQLMFGGLTRELPLVAFAFEEGIWMVGKIDEIRMPIFESDHNHNHNRNRNRNDNHNPILVETKTRAKDTIPAEAQKRNGRIQLMCYKYLWDNLVSHHNDFPTKQFFDYFGLNGKFTLSKDIQVACADSGFFARTLYDVVTCYKNTCKMLPLAHDQLVIRYEYQKNRSLIDEDKFSYDDGWIKNKIKNCLEFWLGGRDANYVADEEEWKCEFCDFVNDCPAYSDMSDCTESFTSDESYPNPRYYRC
ncbi:PREDICTED: exonuclease V, chloroplastic-like isoform X2 [Lupinus angustifolius]|uniref:exonuclease V, chloroplastic-like isoform X2 n=1 Tax=Lupinus angustifolius TaxID=3871 RepID=UPI00092ED673|nr:PREDICTED: exonuclease V, chloroplastic-like isoform X2 [Lupinus angustifolius]